MSKPRYDRKAAMNKPWSDYQKAIIDFAVNGKGHARVNAVAGSGKSTTLVGIVAHLSSKASITIAAFNKHIAEELSEKVPTSVKCSTAHSIGHGMLIRYSAGEKWDVQENKYKRLATQYIRSNRLPIRELYEGDKNNDAKVIQAIVCNHVAEIIHYLHCTLRPATVESIQRLIWYYQIKTDGLPEKTAEIIYPAIPEIMDMGQDLARENKIIDYDEMLYLPIKWRLYAPTRDFLLIDELQDLNNAMLHIYLKFVEQGARVIGVGDPKQSIMGFSGSNPKSWEDFATKLNPVDLPLSVCYRCPSLHLGLASKIVPQIEEAPNAKAGRIWVHHADKIAELAQPGDLLICRNTAPLVKYCIKLITCGINARVRGRDIAQTLIGYAKKSCKPEQYRNFKTVARAYFDAEILKLSEESEAKIDYLTDILECLLICYDNFSSPNHQAFCARIESIFSDDDDSQPVTFSTIHRSKGDEADRVFILGCNWLPAERYTNLPWQNEQEVNLQYVALTRAKTDLFLIPLPRKAEEPYPEELLRDNWGGMTFPTIVEEDLEEFVELAAIPGFIEANFPHLKDRINRYIRSSPERLERFENAKNELLLEVA